MTIEALWAVDFQNQMDLGSGVVVCETNRIFGGDSGWYYLGRYEVVGQEIKARVEVRHYGGPLTAITGHTPGQTFTIDMVGVLQGKDRIEAAGTVDGDPHQQMHFSFRRLADLP